MAKDHSQKNFSDKTTKLHFNKIALACAIVVASSGASAFELDTGNSDLKARWDSTIKYSVVTRIQDADASGKGVNAGAYAGGDVSSIVSLGDLNFAKKGVVSNRWDLYSEADFTFQEKWGARVSGAAWYDSKYQGDNFPRDTRELMGQKTELLDAFIFGRFEIGNDRPGSFRLGKHALTWGETLFFGSNGVAGAMAPVDYIKLFNVPGSQFKEVMLPVNQVSGQIQVSPELSLGAYYQMEWEPNRIPAAGAFSSYSSAFGEGRGTILGYLPSGGDNKPNKSQFGFQAKIRPANMDTDFGLYALKFNQKDPSMVTGWGMMPGTPFDYRLAYHEDQNLIGGSASTTIGSANVGIEASVRNNVALVNSNGLGSSNPTTTFWPIGRTGHLNVPMVQLLSPTALWDGGNLLAEVGWNRLLSVSQNAGNIDPNATRDAWGMRLIFSPTYFQVLNGLDVSVPIGLGYNPKAKSSSVAMFNGGVNKGGDFSIGVVGDYEKKIKMGLTYTTYLGDAGPVFTNALTYQQYYKDRSTINATVEMSF